MAFRRKAVPVKTQIERTPGVKSREMFWRKKIRRKLSLEAKGTKDFVYTLDFEGNEIPQRKAHFEIHTHLPHKGKASGAIAPSVYDINALSYSMKKGKSKTGIIASITPKGKVAGYTAYKLEKPLTQKAEDELLKKIEKKINKKNYLGKGEKYLKDLAREVQKKGSKLKIRFFPMPGYKVEQKKLQFTKKQQAKKPKL